jgi:hypothetical protein
MLIRRVSGVVRARLGCGEGGARGRWTGLRIRGFGFAFKGFVVRHLLVMGLFFLIIFCFGRMLSALLNSLFHFVRIPTRI